MGISRLIKKLHHRKVCNINIVSDEKINEEYPYGTMKKAYKRSIRLLKEYTSSNNNTLPTSKQWNKFAKDNDCLSSESLHYMGNIQFPKK